MRYATQLRADEVVTKLRGNVGQPPKWFKRPPEPFLGRVEDQSFRIYRNISGHNSFLRILHGRIESCTGGTEVRVRFEIHPAVLAFLIGWVISFGWLAFSDLTLLFP